MIQLKVVVIFSAIVINIFLINAKFAFSKNADPEKINSIQLEDIENAIIIKGIESGTNNALNESDPLEGGIIYNDSFNDIKFKNKYTQKESIIGILRKQDNKWHLTPHKIMKGENLWSIAKKYDTDYRVILKANEINNPNRLNPGRKILVPNRIGINHKILKNETLSVLSKKYGVKKEIIIWHNNIKKNNIKEGELLFIPDAVVRIENIAKNKNSIKKSKETNYNKNIESTEIDKSEKYDNTKKYVKNTTENLKKHIKPLFIWPLKGTITSAFGRRVDPINNKSKFHCGMDIGAEIGTSVMASSDGEAIFSGWKKGYGRVIILKHKDGYITVYAHNKKNNISTGDKVEKGEVIALSGMSGAVTGPHLHFEIRKYVTPLNPYRFLK